MATPPTRRVWSLTNTNAAPKQSDVKIMLTSTVDVEQSTRVPLVSSLQQLLGT
jgi:hypothetical protein